MILRAYEKKATATKIYLITCLYNLRMKESNSVTAHLSANESLIVQLPSEGMTIDKELNALILMNCLPQSWETFIAMVCNMSTTAMPYASATRSILSENASRKSFELTTSGEAYIVQDTNDQHHHIRSSSLGPSTSWYSE